MKKTSEETEFVYLRLQPWNLLTGADKLTENAKNQPKINLKTCIIGANVAKKPLKRLLKGQRSQ